MQATAGNRPSDPAVIATCSELRLSALQREVEEQFFGLFSMGGQWQASRLYAPSGDRADFAILTLIREALKRTLWLENRVGSFARA